MRTLLIILGFVSIGLGITGIFLPLLPTTPFLLLSATLFAKSSPKWYNKLITHKILGSYIVNFKKHKAIPRKVKITTITLLWLCITLSALFATQTTWLRFLLFIIAIGVTIHILSYKTLR